MRKTTFAMSRQRAHQLLNAHKVDQILAPPWQESSAFFGNNARTEPSSTIVDDGKPVARIPETHARELEPLIEAPETLREVHSEVQERTQGKATAADYREAVDRRLDRVHLSTPAPAATEEPINLAPQDSSPSIEELADEHDHDGAVAAARLNAQYSSGIAAALKLTFLDARAVVGLLGRDRRLVHGENARMLRRWLDAVDIELRAAEAQPLRMVGGMHG
jgi:hypothetical protein